MDRGRARAAVSVRCDSQERLPPRLRFVRLERGEAADAEKLGVSAPSGFQGRRHGRAAEPASPPAQTSSLDREFRCQGLCRAHPEPQELRPFPKAAIFLSQDSHRALPRRFLCPLLWGQGDIQAASSAGRPSPCKRGSLRCRGPPRGALQGSLPPPCGRGALSMGGGAAGGKAPSGHLLGPPGLRPFQAHGSDSAPPFPTMRPWPSE